MNINEYIASGILEQYALGLATPEQSREVEEMVLQHVAVRNELLAIQDALVQFTAAQAQAPPRSLEADILRSIGGQPGTALPGEAPQKIARKSPLTTALLAVLLACAALGLFYFFTENNRCEEELQALRGELTQLRTDCEEIRNSNNELSQYIAVVSEKGNRLVPMNGTPIAPEALAVVHYNQENRSAYLDVRNLPAPPSNKQYQLWAIVNGQPTDMGVFDIGDEQLALQTIPYIENPEAFAVTLEDAGGSPAPTLDQMYVVGSI